MRVDKNLLKVYPVLLVLCIGVYCVFSFLNTRSEQDGGLSLKLIAQDNLPCFTCGAGTTVEAASIPPVLKDKAHVVFTMDDGWLSEYTESYPILSKYGFKGSVAVIPSRVGRERYMSLDQLRELHDKGWDLLNHTFHHYDLSKLSKDQQREEVNSAREWMSTHCMPENSDVVVYPYGTYNKSMEEVIKEEGYRGARSLESVQKGDKHSELLVLYPGLKPSDVKDIIDKAVESRQDIILVNHKFSLEADKYDMNYDPKDFEAVVKYIASQKDQLEVITYSQWMKLHH
jgi:peptidoglycan/xylan/chitin deacetylase (PgdA/CDA1 family)